MARPKIKFDLDEVEKLGAIGATQEEMAGWFDITTRTIERRMAEDDGEGEFSRAYKKGYSRVKMSLRRQQLELANNGNPTMQIWLGKQMLGQKDKMETQNESIIHNHNKGSIKFEVTPEIEEKLLAISDMQKAMVKPEGLSDEK